MVAIGVESPLLEADMPGPSPPPPTKVDECVRSSAGLGYKRPPPEVDDGPPCDEEPAAIIGAVVVDDGENPPPVALPLLPVLDKATLGYGYNPPPFAEVEGDGEWTAAATAPDADVCDPFRLPEGVMRALAAYGCTWLAIFSSL